MNRKMMLALLGALVVLGVSALALYFIRLADRPPEMGEIGRAVFKSLPAAQVARITLADSKATLTIVRENGVWKIVERRGFPADAEKVRQLVLSAVNMTIGQVESVSAKDRARLELADPGSAAGVGTSIEFADAAGKSLVRLLVGKPYFSRPPDDPAKAIPDGRFVLLPERPERALIVGDALALASTKSADWIDHSGFAIEFDRTIRFEYRAADGATWAVERRHAPELYRLVGLKSSEKFNVSKASSAVFGVNGVALADVAANDFPIARAGFERGAMLTATTDDGLVYTVRLGDVVDDSMCVQVAISGEPVRTRPRFADESDAERATRESEFAERVGKVAARLPAEKALSSWILLVPKSTFRNTMLDRSDLIMPVLPPRKR